MKTYHGYRLPAGDGVRTPPTVTVSESGSRAAPRPLATRLDLRGHSPDGFEWGYGGSGPAQLALALAADVLGDDEAAVAVYQGLKAHVVGGLPHDGWTLTEEDLRAAIERVAHRQTDTLEAPE